MEIVVCSMAEFNSKWNDTHPEERRGDEGVRASLRLLLTGDTLFIASDSKQEEITNG